MKRAGIFLLIIFFLICVSCSKERNGELVLLHTNDFHGSLLPNSGRGGLAEMAAVIKAVKAVNPQVLLLDAGDFNTGSALSNMFNAEPEILGFNILGYDAVVFGNHEFDGTQEKLDRQIEIAGFPFVSSNIKKQDGSFLGGNQYIVKYYDNFSVGIFGITTLRTRIIASPDKSLVFINEIDAAREVVNILRNDEKVDIVIGLTHLGDVKESADHVTSIELAAAVPGIDIIVDGHSHSFFDTVINVGNTWIVSANEWGKYIGYGRIKVQGGKIANFMWTPIPVGPDPEIIAMLEPYIEKAGVTLKENIGEAADTFIFGNRLTRYQETSIGNLVTDSNVWYFREISKLNIDFAFHNGGNIRAELPKGQITQEQILTILPFDNYLYIVSMKGSDILKLFDFIAAIPQGNGGFPQFSGDVRYTIDKTGDTGTIRELLIGGERVDPERTYQFCTNDYILGGGDGYEVMSNTFYPFNTSLLLSYVVVEYIKAQQSPVAPVIDGRLNVIGGITP